MTRLTRYDPFDELFRGFLMKPVGFGGEAETPAIKMDVKETGDAYRVHAEMPGVKKEDIHVSVDGNRVMLSAEVRRESEEKEGERVLRSERYFGTVSRTFELAHDIDDVQAEAKFNDGVLELTLPKRAASTTKELAVH